MRTICLLFITMCLSISVFAAERKLYSTEQDRQIFDNYISYIKEKELTEREIIMKTADFFLDVPYVAATLEKNPEGLVINLRELDCTTFVETVLSLSKTVAERKLTFEAYCDNLQQLRYRDGKVDGYASRLHYTTDWIRNNEQMGLMKDITNKAGGELLPINLFFMSQNADKYELLKDNSLLIDKMAEIEKEVNEHSYFFIPKDEIESNREQIKDGDMICFVTSIKGLDISHVAIAKWVSGKLTFIHASSSYKKVIVQPGTLQEYCEEIKSNMGIMVIRPTFL